VDKWITVDPVIDWGPGDGIVPTFSQLGSVGPDPNSHLIPAFAGVRISDRQQIAGHHVGFMDQPEVIDGLFNRFFKPGIQ
jgi:hypothetical protein